MVEDNMLQKFVQTLLEDKERLEKKIESLKDMDFGDSPGDDNEEADESEEASNELATVSVLQRRLIDIEDALQRVERGVYGKCIRCSGEISQELLEASPESGLCKACKSI